MTLGASDPSTRADRTAGCLLAGAAGDALGAPVEFLSLAAIRRRYGPGGIRDFDRAYGRLGAITDDTQMTLFTAEGLVRARGQDPRPELYRAYLRWLVTQGDDVPSHLLGDGGGLLEVEGLHAPRGPGHTCLSALRSGIVGTREIRINESKGCGGVMRAAPAGLIAAADPFALGCDLAAITHSHPAGFLSAGFLALLIDRILAGESLETAIGAALHRLEREPEHQETARAVRRGVEAAGHVATQATAPTGSGRHGAPPAPEDVERLGGGWVGEEALSIALFCALSHPRDLERALILAANHSGDTDSTAAITGNIMGALLGRGALPQRWLEGLELREVIEEVAGELAAL